MMFTRMAFRGIWLAVFFSGFLGMANTVYAGSQLWSHKFDKDVQWHRVTDVGNFLVGTENGIYCFDSEVGEVAWSREDLAKIPEFNVEEIKGTPFLLVSEVEGKVNVKTTLHAVNVLTGEDVWKTDAVKGVGVDAVPIPSKGFVLLMTTPFAVPKEKLGLVALDLGTGDVVWESQFEEKVDLTIAEGSGKWFAKYDLSGHQPPVVEGDAIYFTYAGLHRYNLGTGSLVWGLKYDVTEKNLKRANAQPVIDGEVIYTSAKGEIRAIDKNSGGLMWKSKKKFGGAVAEVASMGEVLLCRTGGNFYDGMKREWDLKKPLGVAAVDKSTGETIWKYDDAKDSITNMVVLKDAGLVLIADAKNLIGLDATNRDKKPQEVFKEKLEFKDKMGAKGGGESFEVQDGGVERVAGWRQ